MELYEHQRTIISKDDRQALIALGTGGGKTRVCLELATGRILVIAPKQQRIDKTWERNLTKFNIDKEITVVSKEEFRRDYKSLGKFDTLIIDECHTTLGFYPDVVQKKGTEVPKTSQLFSAVHEYIKEHQPERFYPASATPAPKAMNAYALGLLMGKKWDFYKFRARFYIERKMGYRRIYIQKKDKATIELLVKTVKSLGYTGQLSDWFDVPTQIHKIIHVDLTKQQKDRIKQIEEEEADPMVLRAKLRTIENGVLYDIGVTQNKKEEDVISRSTEEIDDNKIEEIKTLALEFRKMLVFAAYTGQVLKIEKALKKEGHKVVTLMGSTKNRETLIGEADKSDGCIVIAQASISSGYELKSFPCVVFASKSNKLVDYIQGLGRVLRADAIKKNLYVHLVTKYNAGTAKKKKQGADEACHESIMAGEDYQEALMS